MSTDTKSVERLARSLCAQESEIWDEAPQSYRDRWMREAEDQFATRGAIEALRAERDAATARVAELERLVVIADPRCEQCLDPATTLDSAGDAACAACAAKKENRDG